MVRIGRSLVVLGLCACSVLATAEDSANSPLYLCGMLPDALRDLRAEGLDIVFSSNVVRDDMQITRAPVADSSPRQILDQLLSPHGLSAIDGAGGRMLVIRGIGDQVAQPWAIASRTLPESADSNHLSDPGHRVLPAWIDQATSSALAQLNVPNTRGKPLDLAPGTRYLILAVPPYSGTAPSFEQIAYQIKALAVEARAQIEGLEIALETAPGTVDRLLRHGLAPYLDAYVVPTSGDCFGGAVGAGPKGDPAGRLWWRAPTDPHRKPLRTLLRGASLGAELVLMTSQRLDAFHRAFLELIQATPSIDLERQPQVRGLDPDRVHFLQDLETGAHYLAIYAEPARKQTLELALDEDLRATVLFPVGAAFTFAQNGRRHELTIPGDYELYFFELSPPQRQTSHASLQVRGKDFVDPYEVVVRNQIFQQRESTKYHSLDVMEKRHSMPQNRVARQYTWKHRIIQRRGEFTEYHHLGVMLNGAPVPERKLRVGRDFRAEASIELEPLEIELDQTYRYIFLGEDQVNGSLTWKIGFEPINPGSYLSGIVWIDQKTQAHRKLRAVHTGLRGPLISREITREYGWIADQDQCFWNWTRSTGLAVVEAIHSEISYAIDTERFDFKYNRPDIEDEVREAHASHLPIHVEMPPDGHRWLIKKKKQRRRFLDRLFRRVEKSPAEDDELPPIPHDLESSSQQAPDARILGPRDTSSSAYDLFVLWREDCLLGDCSGLGLSYHRRHLFKNDAEIYGQFFQGRTSASLIYPRLFSTNWVMTASLSRDLLFGQDQVISRGAMQIDELEFRQASFWLSAARPVHRNLRFRGFLGLRQLDLRGAEDAGPEFTIPQSFTEQIGKIDLDFHRRRLFSRLSFEFGTRDRGQSWGLNLSEPFHRSYRRIEWRAGFLTRLKNDQSFGSQVFFQKGWDLDHFSSFVSADPGLGVAGFRPRRFEEGIGLGVSYSRSFWQRFPVTLRLDAATLRQNGSLPSTTDHLGISLDTFIRGPLHIDLFIKLNYGLYSSRDDEAGRLRSSIVLSRRF